MKSNQEYFEVVDEQGKVMRLASRQECHSNPALLHRVVHVMVFDLSGRLFLQKRSIHKDIQPGKWDTSAGGHVCPGESLEHAAQRELSEELGLPRVKLEHMYHYIMRSPVETELVNSYCTIWDGQFNINHMEMETGRFWELEEIEHHLGKGLFTPNFEDEYRRWREWVRTLEENPS